MIREIIENISRVIQWWFVIILRDFERFWKLLTGFERFWEILKGFGRFWGVLKGFGEVEPAPCETVSAVSYARAPWAETFQRTFQNLSNTFQNLSKTVQKLSRVERFRTVFERFEKFLKGFRPGSPRIWDCWGSLTRRGLHFSATFQNLSKPSSAFEVT